MAIRAGVSAFTLGKQVRHQRSVRVSKRPDNRAPTENDGRARDATIRQYKRGTPANASSQAAQGPAVEPKALEALRPIDALGINVSVVTDLAEGITKTGNKNFTNMLNHSARDGLR